MEKDVEESKYKAERALIDEAMKLKIYGITRDSDYPDAYHISSYPEGYEPKEGERVFNILTGHGGALNYIKAFNKMFEDPWEEDATGCRIQEDINNGNYFGD